MELNRTPDKLDRNARNKENDNWDIIEGETKSIGNKVDNFIEEVTEDTFDRIIDNVSMDWKEPVEEFIELPSDAEDGDARMTRDDGKVYRYQDGEWLEVQQINPTAINEVDERLTSQLAETDRQITFVSNSKADKTYVENLFENLGELEIKGTYNSVDELNDAYPGGTTGLYEVDGKLYTWSGSEWKVVFTLEVSPWDDFMTTAEEEWVV